jgi:hypothetical protein
MVKEPYPAGRVVTRMLIADTGKVIGSCIARTTLTQAEAEACIAEAVLKWEFPKPAGGGVVIVDYPFGLVPY